MSNPTVSTQNIIVLKMQCNTIENGIANFIGVAEPPNPNDPRPVLSGVPDDPSNPFVKGKDYFLSLSVSLP